MLPCPHTEQLVYEPPADLGDPLEVQHSLAESLQSGGDALRLGRGYEAASLLEHPECGIGNVETTSTASLTSSAINQWRQRSGTGASVRASAVMSRAADETRCLRHSIAPEPIASLRPSEPDAAAQARERTPRVQTQGLMLRDRTTTHAARPAARSHRGAAAAATLPGRASASSGASPCVDVW